MKLLYLDPRPLVLALAISGALLFQLENSVAGHSDAIDQALIERLQQLGFTGNIEATLEQRLGRPVDASRANVGRRRVISDGVACPSECSSRTTAPESGRRCDTGDNHEVQTPGARCADP